MNSKCCIWTKLYTPRKKCSAFIYFYLGKNNLKNISIKFPPTLYAIQALK